MPPRGDSVHDRRVPAQGAIASSWYPLARAAMNRIDEVRYLTRRVERRARFAVGYLIICGTVLTLFVVAMMR